jgi:Holliday junction resolvasome RuvABC DNA-binding subunit
VHAPTWARSTAADPERHRKLRTQAKEALIGLGWKPAIANAAAASAFAALGAETTLERLIFDALRRCRPPTG